MCNSTPCESMVVRCFNDTSTVKGCRTVPMSWRLLFIFVVLLLTASGLSGVALGNWLVDQAPRITGEPRTNTSRPIEIVLDAAGRPLASEAPQPLTDGTLGLPRSQPEPLWQVQPVSLFDMALDPMVVLARGDESYTVSDMLTQAGQGLAQGPADIGTIDLTGAGAGAPPTNNAAQASSGSSVRATEQTWQQQLDAAIKACASVGFFSRPGCIERARRKFCDPNQGWGRDALCPLNQ